MSNKNIKKTGKNIKNHLYEEGVTPLRRQDMAERQRSPVHKFNPN